MSSRAHRWPGDAHPLLNVHGGTKEAAKRAIKEAKEQQFAEARASAAIVIERTQRRETPSAKAKPAKNAQGDVTIIFVRKDRVRPRAQLEAAAKWNSRWNCRPTGRRQHWRPRADATLPRMSLEMDEAHARRTMLVEAQDGKCALCGLALSMLEIHHPSRRPSVDHVVPRYLGGMDEGNVVAAHNQCNADKSNDMPTGCELVWLAAVNAKLALPNPIEQRVKV